MTGVGVRVGWVSRLLVREEEIAVRRRKAARVMEELEKGGQCLRGGEEMLQRCRAGAELVAHSRACAFMLRAVQEEVGNRFTGLSAVGAQNMHP